MSKIFKPGEHAPVSGQYEQTGPRGGLTGEERTVVRGAPLPPTPKPGMAYKLVDPTKHKSGR
ncbi:hypothetical protein DY468_08555 [Rhodopseudomonas sp. BR0M22]|nr:hypothetical protein [Rhodopseudomonas sp. BR0M22]